jgi:hypothetical protein
MNQNNWQTTISKHPIKNKKAWYLRIAITFKTKIIHLRLTTADDRQVAMSENTCDINR